MGNACGCSKSTSDYQLLNFYQKNSYHNGLQQDEQKLRIILDRIAPGYSNEQYKKLASYISHQPKLQFTDSKFKYLQAQGDHEVSSLQKMYDFSKRRLQYVYKPRRTQLHIFDQKDVQLCYLCTVFYLICQSQQLKQRIFVTRYINPHYAYIVHLYCNGQPCDVVIDQLVPTTKYNIKYLSIRHPEQIWPFLLEKAWCKQIGGYDKAKGLSPEDCFEQITGIPAQSYSLKQRSPNRSLEILREAHIKGFWIALTAVGDQIDGLKPRQVFFLQKYNQKSQNLLIRSPYLSKLQYPFGRMSDNNQIQVKFDQILANFQFITIGHYMRNYINKSYAFTSKRYQQVIFEIRIKRPQSINIRLIQFYQQYLSNQEKQNYRYSPVLMELYDENCKIVERCQGRLENLEGIRSSNLSENIFVTVNPGLYYLRVQVDWLNQTQSGQAHIVSYSPRQSLQIRKYEGDTLDLAAKLLAMTLQNSETERIQNKNQQLQIKFLEKSYGYVLGVENVSTNPANFKIIFKDSKNIMINHHDLKKNILLIKLDGLQQRVMEVLPANPREAYCLAPFDVVKL